MMDRISLRLVEQPSRRRPKQRRLNLRGICLVMVLAIGVIASIGWVGQAIAPLAQARFAETMQDLNAVSAGKGLPPFCFLASLVLATFTGVCVYKQGPRRGFAVASGLTAFGLLLLLWAVSASREPLDSIRLNDVQAGDVLYVSTYFLPFFFPLLSFGAWYLSTLNLKH